MVKRLENYVHVMPVPIFITYASLQKSIEMEGIHILSTFSS